MAKLKRFVREDVKEAIHEIAKDSALGELVHLPCADSIEEHCKNAAHAFDVYQHVLAHLCFNLDVYPNELFDDLILEVERS